MQALYNHAGDLIAYQYQNMIIRPDNLKVLGGASNRVIVYSVTRQKYWENYFNRKCILFTEKG